jgi:hypothetical protein
MRDMIQIILLIFISTTSFGQIPNKIIKTEKELYVKLKTNEKDSLSFNRYYKEYDKSENIIISIDYCPGSFGCSKSDFEFERKHQYKYDEYGNEILNLFFSKGSKTPSVSTVSSNKYDSLGSLIKKTIKKFYITESDTTDWGTHVNTYEYDINGNLIKKTDEVINEFNPRKWETLYKYDSANNLIELIQPSDYLEIREKYTYDSNGNCANYIMIGGQTTIHNVEKWEQHFNSKGNVVERIETTYNGKVRIIKFSYNKDDLPEKIIFQSDGIMQKSIEKKYDEIGNVIEIRNIGSDGEVENINRFIYEYY